jgi:hypothetical protein
VNGFNRLAAKMIKIITLGVNFIIGNLALGMPLTKRSIGDSNDTIYQWPGSNNIGQDVSFFEKRV